MFRAAFTSLFQTVSLLLQNSTGWRDGPLSPFALRCAFRSLCTFKLVRVKYKRMNSSSTNHMLLPSSSNSLTPVSAVELDPPPSSSSSSNFNTLY
ncbi:hypothetical protein V1521DRAFT_429433 [Lipomyces starkeyi]